MARRVPPNWLAVAAALLPALLVGWLSLRFAPDLPMVDEWSLVQDIDHFLDGSLSWSEVWRSHNGHRIPLPRMIQVWLAVASDWDVRWPIAAGWVAMLVAATVAWRRFAPALAGLPSTTRIATLGVAALAMFSTNQYENWLWGFMLCAFLAVATTTVSLVLLAADDLSWPGFLGALALALAASLSFGSALAVWPAGFLVLLLSPDRRHRGPQLIGWGAAALGLAWIYLSPAPGDANATSAGGILSQPLAGLYFLLTFLGAPVVSYAGSSWPPRDLGVGFAVGLVAFAILSASLVSWWRRGRPALASWARFAVGWVTVSMGAAFLSALGRTDSGGPGAFASRYATWSTPLWLVLLVMAARVARSDEMGAGRLVRLWLSLALAASIGASWVAALPNFRSRQEVLALADDALYHGGPESLLTYMTPDVPQIHAGRPVIERRRLSVFHHPRRPRLAEPIALADYARTLTLAGDLALTARLPVRLEVELENSSRSAWPYLGSDAGQAGAVRLATRWRLPDGRVIAEGPRTDLPQDIAPGERLAGSVCVVTPPAGHYLLELDLVQEGVAWFADRGAAPSRHPVMVRESPARLIRRVTGIAWWLLGGDACR